MRRFILRFVIISFCFCLIITFRAKARGEDPCLPKFSAYFDPVEAGSISPNIPEYDLPLDPNKIVNYQQICKLSDPQYEWYYAYTHGLYEIDPIQHPLITLSPSGDIYKMLLDQGFTVAHFPKAPLCSMVKFYKQLQWQEIPIFITSDSLLHLYHVQFDETLLEIEEREFYGDILSFTQVMLSESKTQYENYTDDLKEAAERNEAFFSVAIKLLDPSGDSPVSSYIQQEVDAILNLIDKHMGFDSDPIFKYMEDYSQYVPRGHYTRSETLKQYFRAMMWYGRMAFLLKGSNNYGITESNDALISEQNVRIQTLQAAMIAEAMPRLSIADKSLFDLWWRIYMVTSFYVGISDDLTPYEYLNSLKNAYDGAPIDIAVMAASDEIFFNFKAQLAFLPSPKIYGGTGQAKVNPDIPFENLTVELLEDYLDKTKGMRLMGQRYVPDSYLMGQLVFPSVNCLKGEMCFTAVPTLLNTCPDVPLPGYVRGFPRGLDVMAVLGSKRAKKILDAFGDTNYEGYEEQFNKLKEEFKDFGVDEWNKNLYWSWLYCLKALLKRPRCGHPTFMQTDAWQDKQLNTALASWTELRHDTILYAKQSYGGGAICAPPVPPRVVGYIEPLPEFYARLLTLTRMTNQGLSSMDCLDQSAQTRLTNLEAILERLMELSLKELRNEPLSEDDYDFIDDFGDHLEGVVLNVSNKGLNHRLVADVHTDINTNQVLEEGIGELDILLAAYKVPDGRIIIGAGPVFSYFEFKHPMSNRLTDGAWRQLMWTNCPPRPAWIGSFCLDKDNKDQRVGLPYTLNLKGEDLVVNIFPIIKLFPYNYNPYPLFLPGYYGDRYPFSGSYSGSYVSPLFSPDYNYFYSNWPIYSLWPGPDYTFRSDQSLFNKHPYFNSGYPYFNYVYPEFDDFRYFPYRYDLFYPFLQ